MLSVHITRGLAKTLLVCDIVPMGVYPLIDGTFSNSIQVV